MKKVETPKRVETKKVKNFTSKLAENTKPINILENTLSNVKSKNNNDFHTKLYEFVKKGEGQFQYKAFCDDYYKQQGKLIRKSGKTCKRWSIGYGTKSYQGERITYEEGIQRKTDDLKLRNNLITSTCLTDNQKIVVLDFMYQHGNNSSNMKYFANNCQTTKIYYTIAGWRDYYKTKHWYGMQKREQLRLNYFYKKD